MSFFLVKEALTGGEIFYSCNTYNFQMNTKKYTCRDFFVVFLGRVLMVVGFSLLKIFEEGDQRGRGASLNFFHISPHKTLSYFFLSII